MRAPTWLLLLLSVLIIGNGYNAAGTVLEATNPAAPALPFVPAAHIGLAVLWIILLVAELLGLFREQPIAFTAAAPLLTGYAAIGLLWNLLFEQSTYSRGSQPFDVLLTLIVLAPVWWVSLRHGWIRRPIPGMD